MPPTDTELAPDEVLTDDFGSSTFDGQLSDNLGPNDYIPVPTDWDFLNPNTPDNDYDPDETIDAYEARMEAKAKADAEAPADTAPKDPAPDDKVEATTDEVKQKVEYWDKFQETYEKNPAMLAQIALAAMSEDQKSAFLKGIGATSTPAAPARELPDIADDYEPQSELEAALAPRWADVKSIPELQRQITELQSGMGEASKAAARAIHDEPVARSIFYGETALAKLDAICDALGLDLPTPDEREISEILKDGRTNIRTAVHKVIGDSFKKRSAEYKQSRVERPKTPGNSSTRGQKPNPDADMVEIAREMGLLA